MTALISLLARSILLMVLCPLQSAASGSPAGNPEALIEAGHWKKARAILEPRVEANPNDAQAAFLLSKVKVAFGDLEGALKLARRAVALDGSKATFHYQLAVVYGEMADRAGLLGAARLVGKFKRELEAALALDPNHLDALEAKMLFCFQAPGLMGGDKSRARALAEQIERLNAARGYLARVELAQEEKNTANIETFFLKALAADPRNYEAQTGIASFYGSPSQKKYDLAAKYAHQALQLEPERVKEYSTLARLSALQERWGELDAILALAAKNVPDNLDPFYEAASALLETGRDLNRAEAYLRKYLAQEPEGEGPGTADAHRLLGLVLEKQGRTLEARDEVETAVRMKPDFDAAKKDLKRLKAKLK